MANTETDTGKLLMQVRFRLPVRLLMQMQCLPPRKLLMQVQCLPPRKLPHLSIRRTI